MPVSKRTRYEVLKRDGHACRYCGQMAPEVKLTVDHVTPVALGGTDKPDNLVAACVDCNAGKASTSPDAAVVAQVTEDALRWGEAVKVAGSRMLEDFETDEERHDWFLIGWKAWDEELAYLPNGWAKSLDCWIAAGLPRPILVHCLRIAMDATHVAHRGVFAYMGGVARKKIEELHESARQILDFKEAEPDGA